jgi:hypothetical protein
MHRIAWILSGLLLSFASSAQNLSHFNDWLVGCDNRNYCTIIAFPSKQSLTKGFVKLTRDAPPPSSPTVTVIVDKHFSSAGEKLQLVFQPGPKPAIETEPLVLGAKYLKAVLASEATKVFIQNLNESEVMLIKAHPTLSNANSVISISLIGAAGALTFMDDKQQRYRAQSSQAIQANQADSIAQGGMALPQQAKQMKLLHGNLPSLPASLLQYKASTGACAKDDAPRALVAILSDSEILWGLCKSVQNNNVDYAFYIVQDGQARAASFAAPPGEPDWQGVLSNPDISNEDRVLSSFKLANQKGDCGVLGEWIWNGEKFSLLTYRKMTDCRGLFDTQEWPRLYKADNNKINE